MIDSSSSEELDLTHYIDVFLRRRWIIIASVVIVFVATALVTFTTRPVYQAEALLVIEKERSSTIQSVSLIENANDDYYQTQYKLLQSTTSSPESMLI